MSEYKNADLNKIAEQAERDLNSDAAKKGHAESLSAHESGVDAGVERKFPGAQVTYGSAASGAGNNRDIPLEEGGDVNPKTGQLYKAGDFAHGGVGAPEVNDETSAKTHGGSSSSSINYRPGT
ncbi:hypothetical protein BU23DRAFT_554928 [Bimuria novae-zelandiae CBS 107.79]|uniref:Uncharacterized protein n=1 Tax=Bimuria novae-zelandiae CBS 107.79 TaxID=1447943 RepID=A0A6A5V6B1_9PLEO|nr:hypothetical protein BU23DRAFT_554928 [Bimuria novae-zelandiae CBS 107.79]